MSDNKTTWTYLSVVCMGLLWLSCSPSRQYRTQLAQIDSCLTQIDSLHHLNEQLPYDSLRQMVEHVLRNEDSIKKYYREDTIPTEVGIRLNDCKGVRKTLKGAASKKGVFQREIAALRQQFTDLKTDIQNGLLKKEQIQHYVTTEKEDMQLLYDSFHTFYTLQQREKKYYYASAPIVDSFIVVLKRNYPQNE